jgi:fructokinase
MIAELIALADVVKLSDEDLEWLYPRHDARQLAYGWLDRGASIVIVTLGGGGALTFTSSGEIRTPAEKVAVVDTVGAGDTFTGALLSFLLDLGVLGAPQRELLREIPAEPLEAALHYAARAAAITVGRAGANPPWLGELA